MEVAKDVAAIVPEILMLRNTEMLFNALLVTTISNRPSPSRSAKVIPLGVAPDGVVIFTEEAKLIVPLVEVFLIATTLLFETLLAAHTKSGLPSPSISAMVLMLKLFDPKRTCTGASK